MGSLTPNPARQHKNIKLTSNGEKQNEETTENCELPQTIKRYKKANIKNRAPNWVQKNIKYAASTHLLVFANLYKMKNEGTSNISYARKNKTRESVKNKTYPAISII